MADTNDGDLTTLTVQLLSAYVSNNQVPAGELAGLIQSTRAALGPNVEPVAEPEPEPEPEHKPAVTARKSLASRDHIISLIDGRPYKSLKRHLSARGLSPADYRERYKLAKDYPMVAPGYSEQRREVAKRLGLGRKAAVSVTVPAVEETPTGISEPVVEASAPPVAAKAPRRKLGIAAAADPEAKAVRLKEKQTEAAPFATNAAAAPKKPRKPAAARATAPASAPEPKRRGRKAAAEPVSDAG